MIDPADPPPPAIVAGQIEELRDRVEQLPPRWAALVAELYRIHPEAERRCAVRTTPTRRV